MFTRAKIWTLWEIAVALYCRDNLGLSPTSICMNLNRTPGAIRTRLHKFDNSSNNAEKELVRDYMDDYIGDDYGLKDIINVIKQKGMTHNTKKTEATKLFHLKVAFEIGDLVECPYYSFRGIIENFSVCDGMTYVNLKNSKGKKCATRIAQWSSNDTLPCYLRMICKAEVITKVLNKTLGI